MPDIIKENKKYFNAVLQSVVHLHETETAIENEKNMIAQLSDFLTKNADEINKFQAIENEIVDYLKQFSFAGKMDFSPIKSKLQPLPALRQKLVEMGKEAQKLAGLPDRYNCFKAMEACKNLTLFCRNEMKSTDYDRIIKSLDTNIPKLLVIQKEFEKEKQILADIKNVLKNNNALLAKYSSFNNELQQFVAVFPNNRDTDLKTVEQRITVLKDINQQTEDIVKTLTKIKPYTDRYNKNSAVKQAESFLSSMYAQMKFGDVSNIKTKLQQINSTLKNIIANFDQEAKEITILYDNLKKKAPDIWEEDNKQMLSELDSIIKKGTTNSIFTLQTYYSRIQTAINKKAQESNILQKYKWLKRKRYAPQVASLKTGRKKLSDFQLEVERIRNSRGLLTRFYEAIFYK